MVERPQRPAVRQQALVRRRAVAHLELVGRRARRQREAAVHRQGARRRAPVLRAARVARRVQVQVLVREVVRKRSDAPHAVGVTCFWSYSTSNVCAVSAVRSSGDMHVLREVNELFDHEICLRHAALGARTRALCCLREMNACYCFPHKCTVPFTHDWPSRSAAIERRQSVCRHTRRLTTTTGGVFQPFFVRNRR